ncbi:MAG: AMP-binding protein [Nannocystaceae bacterium]
MSWADPGFALLQPDGTPLPLAQLQARAQSLAWSPAYSAARVLCGTREHLIVALLAAWAHEAIAILPPNLRPGATGGAWRRAHRRAARRRARARHRRAKPWSRAPRPRDRRQIRGCGCRPRAPPARWWRSTRRFRQLLREAAVLVQTLGLGRGSRVLCTVPSHHIYGLLLGVIAPACAGATVHGGTPLQPEAILAALQQHQLDVLVTTPAQLRACSVLPRGAFAVLRCIVSSGAPLTEPVATMVREHLGASVTELLGSSETGGLAWRVHDRVAPPLQPLPGVAIDIDDDGRLWVDAPWLPADAARPMPTQDRVERVAGGFMHRGRIDDVVKIAGIRVALGEVVARVLAIPGVRDAHALRVAAHDGRGDAIALVVATELDAAAIRAVLAPHFDPVVVPRRIACVPELPREGTGKLDRHSALALLGAEAPGLVPQLLHADADGARARATVDAALPCFAGHFPDRPVLPGVMVLELVLATVSRAWPELGALRTAPRVKFTRTIAPGDAVAVVLRRSGARIDFTVERDGEVCATGTLGCDASPEPRAAAVE